MLGTFSPAICLTAHAAPTLANPVEPATNYEAALAAYESGRYAEALRLSETAANLGSSEAAVMAGYIWRHGKTGQTDLVKARQWYEKGSIKGHPDALVALGEMGVHEEAGLTQTDAVSYLTRASDAGRTDAMRALSDMYAMGHGVAVNKAESQRLLEKASQSFDGEATKRLADSLFESDPKTALKHYETAAKNGHIEAAYIAGVMYAENFDIRPDSARSAALLRQAAYGGHPAAMADYGLLVYQGYGAEKSDTEAAEWFRKSAEAGDTEGQFLYAFTLAKGEGTEQNFEEAYYWALKSSDTGVNEYDKDKKQLKDALETKLSPAVVSKVKARL